LRGPHHDDSVPGSSNGTSSTVPSGFSNSCWILPSAASKRLEQTRASLTPSSNNRSDSSRFASPLSSRRTICSRRENASSKLSTFSSLIPSDPLVPRRGSLHRQAGLVDPILCAQRLAQQFSFFEAHLQPFAGAHLRRAGDHLAGGRHAADGVPPGQRPQGAEPVQLAGERLEAPPPGLKPVAEGGFGPVHQLVQHLANLVDPVQRTGQRRASGKIPQALPQLPDVLMDRQPQPLLLI